MKIGLVLPSVPGYTETFFRSKIRGLQSTGYEVILFCSNNNEKFNDCPVFLLPKKSQNAIKQFGYMVWVYFELIPFFKTVKRYIVLERLDGTSWLRLFKRIYNNSPMFKHKLDWLHFGFGTLALDCQNVADATKAKMAVSFRGFDIGVYPIKHPNCYQKLWNKVSKLHVISDDIARLIYQHGFKNQVSIVKITPAINTSFFKASIKQFQNTPVKFTSVARLHWKKGLDYTLEALALLKERGVIFTYTIIGGGSKEEDLKFAVHQLGLQEQVFFLGKLEPEAVKTVLEESHIYIQYSVQEGFCNAVLEAQAMGLLCVVSDAEGLSENVINEKTGWVVPKRQPKLLARKIQEIVDLPVIEKKSISQQAIMRVNEEFNIEKQRKDFIEFYKNN